MKYSIGIDIGTTAVKCVLIDENRTALASTRLEQSSFFPKANYVEQDPLEIYNICLTLIKWVLEETSLEAKDLSCIGLDHQGETCLLWDKNTGEPVYPAITWQDKRMAQEAQSIGQENIEKLCDITGLRADSYYSLWKIKWIMDHVDSVKKRVNDGSVIAGTLNTWIIWKLSGHKSFVTDEASCSVMSMCNPTTKGWNPWILEFFDIPSFALPSIHSSAEYLAYTDPKIFFGAMVPITTSFPDCAAGIIGSSAVEKGDITVSYGTGNFIHCITGEHYLKPINGLTSTVAFSTLSQKTYQTNAICYSAGSAIKWIKDQIGLISDESEINGLVNSVSDTNGVSFVPAFNGLATPFWNQEVRAGFLGISSSTQKAHLVRAVLESSALQVANCCQIIKDCEIPTRRIMAVGGMTVNDFLMQLQADLAGIEVVVPTINEPSFGSALLALNVVEGKKNLSHNFNPIKKTFYPRLSEKDRLEKIRAWSNAVVQILR